MILSRRERARELYLATRGDAFSVNDLRGLGLHVGLSKNAIGSFFGWLGTAGYAIHVRPIRVSHEAGKKRWAWEWEWTEKAGELVAQQTL